MSNDVRVRALGLCFLLMSGWVASAQVSPDRQPREFDPSEGFMHPGLERSRPAWLRNGVVGRELRFRADVSPGRWWVTLWMEAGREDSSTVAVELNGEPHVPVWHAFAPPAEPREEIQRIYRVLHRPVEAATTGVEIVVHGGEDSVRVLGYALTPDPEVRTETHRALLARIEAAGPYDALAYNPDTPDERVYDQQTRATDELERLRDELAELLSRDSSDTFAAYWHRDLGLLIEAERYFATRGWGWADDSTGFGLFERLHQAVMLLDGILDRPEADSYPLYERAFYTRARLLYWLGLERGGPRVVAKGRRHLADLYARHPDDLILAMYAGEPIDLPDACDTLQPAPNAPEWSKAQMEALCRLQDLSHWWVEHQQAPNGEMGGKFGDDVELLRWWSPLILAGDTVTRHGWQRLADGVWTSGRIVKGYARAVSDVEHASEFVADTAPQMIVFSDDSVYLDRLRPSASHFERLWTGLTPSGRRYFRSAWFSSTEIDTTPPKNRDVEYNTRAAKAVRYLAWKTGDPHIIELLHEWSRAWVDAAERTDKGKPAGVLPATIRFPDEAFNGDGSTWHEADMYWPYFDWSHQVGSSMLDQLFFTYTLTGDDTLLDPLIAALDLVRKYKDLSLDETEIGSPGWAAVHLREKSAFWSVVAEWRLLTGETRYDDLLIRYGTPYLRYRLSGDEAHLVEGLDDLLGTIRYNAPLRTYEAIHTDRVYVSDRNRPGAMHLQAMLTGSGTPEGMSPYHAVSWSNTGDAFTALVTDTGPDRLAAHVFLHAPGDHEIGLRIWSLSPGRYRITTDPGEAQIVDLTHRGQTVILSIPGQRLTTIQVEAFEE